MKLVVYEPDSKPLQHSERILIDAEIMEDDEKETDTLPFVLNHGDGVSKTPDRNYFISMDSLRNGKPELFEESRLYTDKCVMECELPEFIVCYKEIFDTRVKDICIDEGAPPTNMILAENGKEKGESSSINDILKYSYTTENGHANQNNDETINDAKDVGDTSKGKLVPENRLLEQYSIQIPNGDSIMLMPTVKFSAEESNLGTIVEELSYDRKVESGSITFHFDPSTPITIDLEPPIESPTAFIPGDDSSDDHQKVSSRIQRDHMESSFTPVSGLITYSGHIAYSGSLSHRSDTSGATSTRSFAFPVLDTEWNSSPVRMAEAERRRFGKHRGWRMGLLCCRF